MNVSIPFKKKKDMEEKMKDIDVGFLAQVAPIGGVSFADEKFIATGTGYEACIYIYGYPSRVSSNWIAAITGHSETVSVIDISSTNTTEIKKNLRKSMEEQSSRAGSAKSSGDFLDAQKQFAELEAMYAEVSGFGNVIKTMIARVFVPARTKYECDAAIKEILAVLEGEGYKAGVCINEAKSDWRNAFLSYGQQQKDIFKRTGQPMLSRAIAGGHFFHFSSLNDPFGVYYGETTTGGSVFLDLFHKSPQRMAYNSAILGTMGSGKSTLLKKILAERAARGDILRVFDVSGEFTQLIEYLGGKVIYLDGQGKSIINFLQILPGDNPQSTYNKHIAKVATIYRYLKPKVEENELLILKQLLNFLYIYKGIVDENGEFKRDIHTMEPEDFPILSDLLNLTKTMLNNFDDFLANSKAMADKKPGVIRESMKTAMENIEAKLVDLCTIYRNIFDGTTSIKDFYKEDIVCFNTSALSSMEDSIYDAQLYIALSACWDNAVSIGNEMKDLYESKQIDWRDITRTLILIDEAHRTINANKMAGIEEIDHMMREGRKYFAGLALASQSVRDFVPDNSESQAIAKIRGLFELTTYKFIMNHDSAAVPKLTEVFQAAFTEDEISRITTIESRQCILSTGAEKLEFEIWAEPVVLDLGSGGA